MMAIAVVLLTTPSYLLATVRKMARITILCAILGVKVGVKVATSSNSDARMIAPIARKICIRYVTNLKCCPFCCLKNYKLYLFSDFYKQSDGTECKPYPKKQKVCGLCGILSDSSFPTGAKLV